MHTYFKLFLYFRSANFCRAFFISDLVTPSSTSMHITPEKKNSCELLTKLKSLCKLYILRKGIFICEIFFFYQMNII